MKYHTGQLNDPICIRVKQYCVSGWPAKQNIGVELIPEIIYRLSLLIPYWRVRDDLSVCKDLLLYGTRIVVPTSLQSLTLQKLHQGHLGIQRCRLRAVSSVWWPGSSQQIYQMVKGCHVCARKNPPPIEPMIPSELPDYPWQKVSSDLKGKMYLLVADYFSRFPEVIQLSTTTSSSVIQTMKAIFARHGIPEQVVTDNGPQYASREMKEFASSYGFCHIN